MRLKWSKGPFSSVGRSLMSVLVLIGLGSGAYYFKSHYTPGPTSAQHPRNEPLGGYSSHAEFESECTHCHAPIHCIGSSRCQECHLDIARQRAETDGLHGVLPGTDKCQTCHTEHRGREAVLSRVAFANLDHQAFAGFDLKDHQTDYAGETMLCESCHTEHRFAREWVDCTTCHADADPLFVADHIATYNEDCIACHDGADRMIEFDHNAAYALDGAHEGTDCEDCHRDNVFVGTPRDCVACHPDPEVHAGQFGLDCSRCHNASDWTQAELTRHTFRLDHGNSGEIACEICHTETYVTHTCYGCHDHTPQGMSEVHREHGLDSYDDCASCHPTGEAGEAEHDDADSVQGTDQSSRSSGTENRGRHLRGTASIQGQDQSGGRSQ